MKAGIALIALGAAVFAGAAAMDSARPPKPELELNLGTEGRTGATKPPVVQPGDTVTLVVHAAEERSVFGRWRADRLQVRGIDWEPSAIESSEDDWEDGIQFGYHETTGPKLDRINLPLRPWIRFRVPGTESLRGRELALQVRLEATYPYTHNARSYEDRTLSIDRRVTFRVGSAGEIETYLRWKQAVASWESRGRFWETAAGASFGILAVCLAAGFFLILRERTGRTRR